MKSVVKTKQATSNKNARAPLRKSAKSKAVTVIAPLKASGLRNALWETLVDLRGNQMPANRADAIAAQAREILRTVKTQLQITNAAKLPVPREIIAFAET